MTQGITSRRLSEPLGCVCTAVTLYPEATAAFSNTASYPVTHRLPPIPDNLSVSCLRGNSEHCSLLGNNSSAPRTFPENRVTGCLPATNTNPCLRISAPQRLREGCTSSPTPEDRASAHLPGSSYLMALTFKQLNYFVHFISFHTSYRFIKENSNGGGGGGASAIVQPGKLHSRAKKRQKGAPSPGHHCLNWFTQVSSAHLPRTALQQPGEHRGPRPVFLRVVFSPWWVKKAKKKETSQSRDMLFR